MKRNKLSGVVKSAVVSLTGMLLLAGCASMTRTPEEKATERAEERLEYYLAGDYAKSYEYLSPGYRSGVSLAEYQRKAISQPMSWKDASVVGSECTESACKLKISIDIVVYGAVPGANKFETKAAATENWIKTGGTWYFVPSS